MFSVRTHLIKNSVYFTPRCSCSAVLTFCGISITSEAYASFFFFSVLQVLKNSGPKQSLSIIQVPSGPGRTSSSLSCWENSTIHVSLLTFFFCCYCLHKQIITGLFSGQMDMVRIVKKWFCAALTITKVTKKYLMKWKRKHGLFFFLKLWNRQMNKPTLDISQTGRTPFNHNYLLKIKQTWTSYHLHFAAPKRIIKRFFLQQNGFQVTSQTSA